MSNKNLLIASISSLAAVSFGGTASAALALFDFEGTNNSFPALTQTDSTAVTSNGAFVNGGVTLNVAGLSAFRARGINAAGVQASDNDDNAVPEGTFANLYQDFGFATSGTVTLALSGLDADTDYLITVATYDSGSSSGGGDFSVGGDLLATTSFAGDLTTTGIDPDTTLLVGGTPGLVETFTVTTDNTGAVAITATPSGIVPINGLQVDVVPEPSSLALLGLGGLLIARRRRG